MDAMSHTIEQALGVPVTASSPIRLEGPGWASRASLADGRIVFAKAAPAPWRPTTEAAGLRWLAEADAVHVPAVFAASDDDAGPFVDDVDEGPPPEVDEHGRRARIEWLPRVLTPHLILEWIS